jgi:hypothetical protein
MSEPIKIEGGITPEMVGITVEKMLTLPQAPCPVVHRFGPGVYIREVFIPAGTFSIGHFQKQSHSNFLVKGSVTMLNGDGTTTFLEAPFFYVSTPCRKIGYIHEDMVWQNIYATTETNVDVLEKMLLDTDEILDADRDIKAEAGFINACADREDYMKLLQELGLTEDQVRAEVENEEDLVPMPYGSFAVAAGKSVIEGRGLFVTAPMRAGDVLAPARVGGKRTPAGRFTNHSSAPNAVMIQRSNGDVDLVALIDLNGSHGGQMGDEITVDYRQARIASRVEV